MAAVSNAKMIAALKDARGLVMVAARRLGISRQQIYRRIESNADVREAVEEARDFTTDTAEAALFKAIASGEAWAVCFYLKCQGKDRGYVERQQIEHTGRDGGPLEITVTRRVVGSPKNRLVHANGNGNGNGRHA